MSLRNAVIWLLACLVLCGPAMAAKANAKPQRIVSLNLCSDQILLDLVPGDRISGLSFLVADPTMSGRAEAGKAHRLLYGRAEEVLALDPDLILVGEYSTPSLVSLLRRLGRNVVQVPQVTRLDDIRGFVRLVSEAVGEETRGEVIIAAFDRRLERLKAGVHNGGPRAIALEVNNIAAGQGTLLDDILKTAGLRNMASALSRSSSGRVALESLVTDPPDLLVLAHRAREFPTVLADNLRHPVVARLKDSRPAVELDMSKYLCGTPDVLDAVARLVEARTVFERQHQAWQSKHP